MCRMSKWQSVLLLSLLSELHDFCRFASLLNRVSYLLQRWTLYMLTGLLIFSSAGHYICNTFLIYLLALVYQRLKNKIWAVVTAMNARFGLVRLQSLFHKRDVDVVYIVTCRNGNLVYTIHILRAKPTRMISVGLAQRCYVYCGVSKGYSI